MLHALEDNPMADTTHNHKLKASKHQQKLKNKMNEYHIILYYKYTILDNPEKEKEQQQTICKFNNLDGRILLSNEGINGTLAGSSYDNIQNYINYLCSHPAFQMKESDFKHSNTISDEKPFPFLQIRLVKEVVSTGYDHEKLKFPNMNVTPP